MSPCTAQQAERIAARVAGAAGRGAAAQPQAAYALRPVREALSLCELRLLARLLDHLQHRLGRHGALHHDALLLEAHVERLDAWPGARGQGGTVVYGCTAARPGRRPAAGGARRHCRCCCALALLLSRHCQAPCAVRGARMVWPHACTARRRAARCNRGSPGILESTRSTAPLQPPHAISTLSTTCGARGQGGERARRRRGKEGRACACVRAQRAQCSATGALVAWADHATRRRAEGPHVASGSHYALPRARAGALRRGRAPHPCAPPPCWLRSLSHARK